MREEISKILVKWSMPTRQVAILELVALFKTKMEEIVKEARPEAYVSDVAFRKLMGKDINEVAKLALDQYESNLLEVLEGKKER